VKNLDRQVLALLAEDVLLFLLDDLTRAVVRIDDVVADLEIDALDLPADVEVFEVLGIGADGALLGRVGPVGPPTGFVARSAGNGPRG
jgi:hypothetical protein